MRKHSWLIFLIFVFFLLLVFTAPTSAAHNNSGALDFLDQIYPVVTQPTGTIAQPSMESTAISTPIFQTPTLPIDMPGVTGSETPTQEVTSAGTTTPEPTSTRGIIGEGYSLIKSDRYEKTNYWVIALGLLATFVLVGIGILFFTKPK